MKKTLAFALALVLFAARSTAEEKIDWGEETVKILEGIATIVDRDQASCNKMAGSLNQYFDEKAPMLALLKKLAPTHTQAEKDAFAAKYRARIQAAQEKMVPGALRCRNDKAVAAAFARMASSI